MGLSFTSDARPPSNVTLLPNQFIRPEFGELYGFDADADADAGSGFNITVRDTQATIIARTGDTVGVIAYGTDTYDLYVYDGTSWQRYENT